MLATGIVPVEPNVATSTMKPLPVTPAAPLDVRRSSKLMAYREWGVGRLGQEQCRHGQIDARSVQIEGVAGWDNETDHRFLAAEVLQFGEPGYEAEQEEDENQARRVDARHQLAELNQPADTVAADREGHRTERTERRCPHDDTDHTKQCVRNDVDQPEQWLSALTHERKGKREEDREEKALELRGEVKG